MSVHTSQDRTEPVVLVTDDVDAGVIEDARTRQRKYRMFGAALIAAAIAAGGLIVGFAGGGGGGSGTGRTGGGGSAGPGPSADFKLLRSQQQSSLAGLPRWVIKSFSIGVRTPSPDKQFGLDVRAARGTELSGGVKVWLIPGRSGSCFAAEGPGASGAGCGANNSYETRGAEQYEQSGKSRRIIGIAPDGVHVTFQLSDGSSVPARLNSDNAYVIVRPLSDPVVATTFTGNGRTITEHAPE